jgi:heme-degrading monooxygenase HmoA
MKTYKKIVLSLATFALTSAFAQADVIEIATFTLNKDVSYKTFKPLDKAVEVQHVAKQPGFISRESAQGENGEWLVVVHWDSLKAADASMKSFMKAKAAGEFMSKIDTTTMSMKRYSK